MPPLDPSPPSPCPLLPPRELRVSFHVWDPSRLVEIILAPRRENRQTPLQPGPNNGGTRFSPAERIYRRLEGQSPFGGSPSPVTRLFSLEILLRGPPRDPGADNFVTVCRGDSSSTGMQHLSIVEPGFPLILVGGWPNSEPGGCTTGISSRF